jgi:two-component system, chemotaxis family, response regulator Rcp1
MNIDTIANKNRPAEILLVEDNYGDVLLTKKAFSSARISNNITVAVNGEQALSMIRREPPYESIPIPDLILLDINLPKCNGKEVLAEIKKDPKFLRIPVIILTSSRAEIDVIKSYNLHANSYLVKPVNMEKFTEVVGAVEKFWLTLVVMPDAGDTPQE